jgi:hypothetical protein
MGEMRSPHKILVANLRRRDHSEDLDVDGKITECSWGKRVVNCGLDASGPG